MRVSRPVGRTSHPSATGSGRHSPRPGTVRGRSARGTAIRRLRGDPGGVRHPAVVVDEQHRPLDRGEQRGRRLAQPLEPLLVVTPQLRLGQPDGGLDERDDRRVQRHRRSADVDDAEQLARARVVQRRGGAVPRVLVGLEVLGGEQLHRTRLRQRGADRVGADQVLGPLGALREAEPVGAVAHPGGALPPQDDAVRVGDDHQELRGVRHRGDDLPELVDHQRDRGGATPREHLLGRQRVTRVAAVRGEPGPQHPGPRPGDQRPRLQHRAAARDHRVVHAHQLAGVAGRSVPGRIALKSPTQASLGRARGSGTSERPGLQRPATLARRSGRVCPGSHAGPATQRLDRS